jgi:hypothetical protein
MKRYLLIDCGRVTRVTRGSQDWFSSEAGFWPFVTRP